MTSSQQPQDSQQAQQQLGVKLLVLQQQEKQIKAEISNVKAELEAMFAADAIAAKTDMSTLFSDGSTRKVRLQRVGTGSYFKVGDDYKDEYSQDSHRLQARYLKAGKAEMAEKAHTWKVQEVKG